MKELLGVIADDFTGACDVGVQFRKRGLETIVLTDADSLSSFKNVFDVLVVDTETRNLPSEDAYRKVRRAVRLLRQNNIELVYKKIDSTLRGNLGAEINAVIDELDIEAVIVTPAFPSQKRTVVNGRLLINGVPIEKTEYADDPLSPVSISQISRLIERQTGRRVGEIHLSEIRRDVNLIIREIQKHIQADKRIIVADAESESDLKRIAEASRALELLPCGSAGLASAISSRITVQSGILIISGSLNSVTLNQIETAVRNLNLRVIQPHLSGVLFDEEKLEAASDELVKESRKTVAEGRDVVIRLADSKSLISEITKAGKNQEMSKLQVADILLSVLSEATRRILEKHNFYGLVLMGGETSIKIIESLGAKAVRIGGEFLPGIPSGRIIGGEYDGMRIVTKAGGFGDSYTLVKIIESMRGNRKLE